MAKIKKEPMPHVRLVCPNHGCGLGPQGTKFGFRYDCPSPGCTVVGWGKPHTSPADKETRDLRSKCHTIFDSMYRGGSTARLPVHKRPTYYRWINRNCAYPWLAQFLRVEPINAHIGLCSRDQCLRLLSVLDPESYQYWHPDEDAFRAALDAAVDYDERAVARADDATPYLVFADYLQEHDDPRADGYRVMGAYGCRPFRSSTVAQWYGQWPRIKKDPWSDIPPQWADALRQGTRGILSTGGKGFFRNYPSHRAARDDAARAWALLLDGERVEVLKLLQGAA